MAEPRKPQRKPTQPRRKRKNRLGILMIAAMLVLVAAYLGALEVSRPHVTGDRLRIDTFLNLVDDGKVRTAHVLDQDSFIEGTYVRPDGSLGRYNAPLIQGSQGTIVLQVLVPSRVPTTVDQQVKKRLAAIALFGLPGLMLVVLFAYLILSYRRGSGLFSVRSGARRIAPEAAGVSFAEVAGHDAAVAELKEVKEYLSDPERFRAIGADVPKGILLYGPPGCGKTMLAKALAQESGASFYSISGSDFVELYVGVGASRVRDLFAEARSTAPAIVFIDEVDSIGRARGGAGAMGGNGEQEQALNQILAEMDGFTPADGILVVAATNRPDVLDKALLRPGRFDRTIGLALPDEEARLAILTVHATRKRLELDVDLAAVARGAIGLSGADLAGVMNESALLAARAGKPAVSQAELDVALHRILEAPERQRRLSQRASSIGRRFTDRDRVTFADVAGQEAAVADLKEIRDFLAHPERFVAMGAVPPKGVLLYGQPGCGKTLMARALAGEANAAFFSIGASEFVEVFVGTGAQRVRDLFAEARSMAPAIIFIDEIDAIGRIRGGGGPTAQSQGSEQEQALTEILSQMDGFSSSKGLIVLAATNRADTLDPALLRPGRFDRTIGLDLPDEKGRLAILSLHAADKRLAPATDLVRVANAAIGLSGADLANVMNEAGVLAVRADKDAITQAELDEALHRTMAAPERQRRLALRARSIGKRFTAEERVTFADVAGADDALEELAEVREYLSDPSRFAAAGARVPRGILMVGPPGCGKTLLARAVAGETNAAFFSVSASEFVEIYVGEGAKRVRDLFADARSMAPSIVFIDELDAIGGHRATNDFGGGRERENTLNQILVELDGFEARSAVIVMGATNRVDMLDHALVRPGRFDRQVTIRPPDRTGRRAILGLYTKDKTLAADVDLDALAGLTFGMSGADLENIINEAALLAVRARAPEITRAMIEEGRDRATMGVASRTTIMSEEERRLVAYHEAGHALVAAHLKGATPPHKLTIIPRGGTLGRCTMLDSHDRVVISRSMMLDQMGALLGGWAAEELVFHDTSSGTASDLQRVGEIARAMVRDYGMSETLGPLGYPDSMSPGGQLRASYSEASATTIDEEVRRLVNEASQRAQRVLTTRRDRLDAIAEALLHKETLDTEELALLSGNVSPVRAKPEDAPEQKRRPGDTGGGSSE